ncbi:LOW QUALITY PROTEIN: hypothetical protein AAY473_011616 [Plecturocebus cupreus]
MALADDGGDFAPNSSGIMGWTVGESLRGDRGGVVLDAIPDDLHVSSSWLRGSGPLGGWLPLATRVFLAPVGAAAKRGLGTWAILLEGGRRLCQPGDGLLPAHRLPLCLLGLLLRCLARRGTTGLLLQGSASWPCLERSSSSEQSGQTQRLPPGPAEGQLAFVLHVEAGGPVEDPQAFLQEVGVKSTSSSRAE